MRRHYSVNHLGRRQLLTTRPPSANTSVVRFRLPTSAMLRWLSARIWHSCSLWRNSHRHGGVLQRQPYQFNQVIGLRKGRTVPGAPRTESCRRPKESSIAPFAPLRLNLWVLSCAGNRSLDPTSFAALNAASVRLRAPRARRSAAVWILLVPSAILNSRAISLFDMP